MLDDTIHYINTAILHLEDALTDDTLNGSDVSELRKVILILEELVLVNE
jgi:hypothetical protein